MYAVVNTWRKGAKRHITYERSAESRRGCQLYQQYWRMLIFTSHVHYPNTALFGFSITNIKPSKQILKITMLFYSALRLLLIFCGKILFDDRPKATPDARPQRTRSLRRIFFRVFLWIMCTRGRQQQQKKVDALCTRSRQATSGLSLTITGYCNLTPLCEVNLHVDSSAMLSWTINFGSSMWQHS